MIAMTQGNRRVEEKRWDVIQVEFDTMMISTPSGSPNGQQYTKSRKKGEPFNIKNPKLKLYKTIHSMSTYMEGKWK